MPNMPQRISMKAVIVNKAGQFLILRKAKYEGNGGKEGKWNNPGGRVEPGEHWQDALRREVKEETGIIDLKIGGPVYVGEWSPNISGTVTQIICLFVVCYVDKAEVSLNYEHDTHEWINGADVDKYEMLAPEDEVIRTTMQRGLQRQP